MILVVIIEENKGPSPKESYYDIFVLTLLKFSVAFICLIAYMLFGLV